MQIREASLKTSTTMGVAQTVVWVNRGVDTETLSSSHGTQFK